ncbi:MAG: PD40 domain-containing protein [Ignavibacteria bacterium]|nr:PD40 domain-containing protein [Ignavibacteria bacterium]
MYKLSLLSVVILLIGFQSSFSQSRPVVEPFLPEIFGLFPNVRDIAISPNRDEIHFTVQSIHNELSAIFRTSLISGKWTEPRIAGFSGKYLDLEPFYSPDGLKLYFVSNRPLNESISKETKDYDIWYLERKVVFDKWSSPINLGAPINTTGNEFFPSLTRTNNLYFTSDGPGTNGKDDIFVSKFIGGKYQAPQPVTDSLNTSGYEFNAFISPDETFMVYTCYNRPGGLGSGDLCISFNKGDGFWTTPFFLGDKVNSTQMDYCPYVDIRTGILYFTSKRSGVQLQRNQPFTTQRFIDEINRYDNGQSRIYMVSINDWIKGVVKKD